MRRSVASIFNITESERMLKALIKSLENRYLNPCPLESLDPFLSDFTSATNFVSC